MFRSVKEFETTADPKPTAAETALIVACRAGVKCVINFGNFPPEDNTDLTIQVRADLIRLLVLDGTPDCGLHEHGVWLEGADITGVLDLRFIKGRGRVVFHACRFNNSPRMEQAHLPQLSLERSLIPGLVAPGITVDGDLHLGGVKANGTVELAGAKIGGSLDCDGAEFDYGKDLVPRWRDGGKTMVPALSLQGAKVERNVFLRKIIATGRLNLSGSYIGGQLTLSESKIDGFGDRALGAQGMVVENGFVFRDLTEVKGLVDLSSVAASRLIDDEPSWAKCRDGLILEGFTYDRISGDTGTIFFNNAESFKTHSARSNWLEKGSRFNDEFFPQPYTQLAKVFRAAGHISESRKVLLARDTILFAEAAKADRKSLNIALKGDQTQRADAGMIWLRLHGRRIWAGLSRRVVGHGHRPEYALFWALAFTCFGTILYFIASRNGLLVPNFAVVMVSQDWLNAVHLNKTAPTDLWNTTPSAAHYETFMAAIYAVDVFLPIVDLGQEGAWAATTTTNWGFALRVGTFAYQVAGWVVTSLGIAAITGFVQRGSPD